MTVQKRFSVCERFLALTAIFTFISSQCLAPTIAFAEEYAQSPTGTYQAQVPAPTAVQPEAPATQATAQTPTSDEFLSGGSPLSPATPVASASAATTTQASAPSTTTAKNPALSSSLSTSVQANTPATSISTTSASPNTVPFLRNPGAGQGQLSLGVDSDGKATVAITGTNYFDGTRQGNYDPATKEVSIDTGTSTITLKLRGDPPAGIVSYDETTKDGVASYTSYFREDGTLEQYVEDTKGATFPVRNVYNMVQIAGKTLIGSVTSQVPQQGTHPQTVSNTFNEYNQAGNQIKSVTTQESRMNNLVVSKSASYVVLDQSQPGKPKIVIVTANAANMDVSAINGTSDSQLFLIDINRATTTEYIYTASKTTFDFSNPMSEATKVVRSVFDDGGRITQKMIYDSTSGSIEQNTYFYDATGALAKIQQTMADGSRIESTYQNDVKIESAYYVADPSDATKSILARKEFFSQSVKVREEQYLLSGVDKGKVNLIYLYDSQTGQKTMRLNYYYNRVNDINPAEGNLLKISYWKPIPGQEERYQFYQKEFYDSEDPAVRKLVQRDTFFYNSPSATQSISSRLDRYRDGVKIYSIDFRVEAGIQTETMTSENGSRVTKWVDYKSVLQLASLAPADRALYQLIPNTGFAGRFVSDVRTLAGEVQNFDIYGRMVQRVMAGGIAHNYFYSSTTAVDYSSRNIETRVSGVVTKLEEFVRVAGADQRARTTFRNLSNAIIQIDEFTANVLSKSTFYGPDNKIQKIETFHTNGITVVKRELFVGGARTENFEYTSTGVITKHENFYAGGIVVSQRENFNTLGTKTSTDSFDTLGRLTLTLVVSGPKTQYTYGANYVEQVVFPTNVTTVATSAIRTYMISGKSVIVDFTVSAVYNRVKQTIGGVPTASAIAASAALDRIAGSGLATYSATRVVVNSLVYSSVTKKYTATCVITGSAGSTPLNRTLIV